MLVVYSLDLLVFQPECVSTHPILKCVDFALPIEDVDFSTIAHASRFLASLRLCRKFLHGLAFIRLQMAALNGPAVLEAARLLADAQIHSRYTSGDQTEINETAVVELSRQLSERVSTSWLPTAMRTTVSKFIKQFSSHDQLHRSLVLNTCQPSLKAFLFESFSLNRRIPSYIYSSFIYFDIYLFVLCT